MATLTAATVKNLREPGRYGDGDGLYLCIAPTGSKSWVQRIQADGKRRDIGLGGYPAVLLAKARELALENRRRATEGKMPLSAKDRRTATREARTPKAAKPTFEEMARTFHAENTGNRWASRKAIKNWLQRGERYVFPLIGDKHLDEIEAVDVLNIVVPLQSVKPETAIRVRQLIKQTYRRAISRGLAVSNPAGEIMAGGLPPRGRQIVHMRSLHYSQVTDALAKVDASPAFMLTKLLARFVALTATRPGEARQASWEEMDLDNEMWTIPASRMKMSREHRVPLSRQALEVLQQAKRLSWDSQLIFPSDRNPGKPLSDNALSKLFRDLEIGAVPHGFRSSFRVWAEEQSSASWAAIELCLAHTVGSNTERAYFRSDLLDQRRQLMQAWGDFLDG